MALLTKLVLKGDEGQSFDTPSSHHDSIKHESNVVLGWTHFPLNHGAEGRMNPPQAHLFDFCGLNMFEQLSLFEHCMQAAIYMDTTAEKSFISRMLKLQILVGIWTHRWNICAIHLKCTKSYSFFFPQQDKCINCLPGFRPLSISYCPWRLRMKGRKRMSQPSQFRKILFSCLPAPLHRSMPEKCDIALYFKVGQFVGYGWRVDNFEG